MFNNDSHIQNRSIDISGMPYFNEHRDIIELVLKNVKSKGGYYIRGAAPKYTWGNVLTTDKKAYYVWRNVMLNLSNKSCHQSMPVCAQTLIWGHACKNELDAIVDYIVNQFPKNEWAGVIRWGRALGAI